MKFFVLNIVFILCFTYTHGQLPAVKTSKKSSKEIYNKLNLHRNLRNYDSSLFYVNELIAYEKQYNQFNYYIRAIFQKIETYETFNKLEDAFRLTLSLEEKYCANSSNNNCKTCNKTYLKLSYFMSIMEDYQKGLSYLNLSCGNSDYVRIQYEKAKLYTLLEKNDSAIFVTQGCIDKVLKQNDNIYNIINAFNNHGLIAQKIGNYDDAINTFISAITIIDSTDNDKHLKPTIQGNLGACYYEKGNIDLAYFYLLQDSKGSLGFNEIISFINAEIALAEIEVLKTSNIKAIKRLEKILDTYNHKLDYSLKEQIFKLLIECFKNTGNTNKLNYYINKWFELNKNEYQTKTTYHQQMVEQFSANMLQQATKQIKTERLLLVQKMLVLKKEKEKDKLRNWLLIIGFIIVIIIILFLFWRYRLVQTKKAVLKESELELAKKEQQLTASELANKKKDLNNVINNLSYKRKFIDDILLKLKTLQEQPKEDLTKNITSLIIEFNQYKSADKGVEILQADIEKVNQSFFNSLSKQFPLLTENEKELCGLFLLKLNSKDIAILRNVTPNAIKKARQRIRKKLPISESQNIVEFLESV